MESDPKLKPEIGPDGLAREAPVIAYTEKIIEEEQLQLKKYIEENYSKIRDVERELANLSMDMKLTAGPKKAALELLRKKIEASTERIHLAKQREDQARKALEAASKAVADEEAIKQKLCEDLNCLVQESSNAQYARLEELKRRLESLNPNRASTSVPQVAVLAVPVQNKSTVDSSSAPVTTQPCSGTTVAGNQHDQKPAVEGEAKPKKKPQILGRGRGIGAVPKGRGAASPGWTGAGFDVDGRT